MEGVDLIPRGTWDSLKASGLRPDAARLELGGSSVEHETSEPVPSRFRTLAVQAFQQALIGEGELARLLRVDRIRARESSRKPRP